MLGRFFSLFSYDLGIDLGTANTLVYVKGKGIVIREPSVVAMHRKTKKVIAVGGDAKKMVGKTPPSIITVNPLKGGVIADFDATEAMIGYYIKQVHERGNLLPASFARPRVVIGIPSAVTEVERRAVWEAALSAGAREAYVIEEPMAAALGENIEIFQSNGVMVVDVGGGTTEVAIISLGGIVVGRSVKMAGTDMDQAILHYVRLKHGILLGERTAESVKIRIGSAYMKVAKGKGHMANSAEHKTKEEKQIEHDESIDVKTEKGEKMAIVRGRDIETGLPKSLRLTETEIREALSPCIAEIVQGVSDVIEEAPPELISDILENGILLTGGGANLAGLDQLIVEQIRMPVLVSDDPLTSVARGTGKVLESPELLAKIKVYGGLK
jgi:rod shape-determining protein MreB